jgi:hypothetical protein
MRPLFTQDRVARSSEHFLDGPLEEWRHEDRLEAGGSPRRSWGCGVNKRFLDADVGLVMVAFAMMATIRACANTAASTPRKMMWRGETTRRELRRFLRHPDHGRAVRDREQAYIRDSLHEPASETLQRSETA